MKKRSVYLAERKAFWLRHFQDPQSMSEDHARGPAAERARLDALAVEAAGVPWEPEEEPLPEKIYNVRGRTSEGNGLRPAEDRYPDGNYSREFWNRLYDEAIRRYNAWPELEELLEQSNICDWPGRLILGRILRGSLR